ncbi:hypothetical protein AAC387_Pa03g4053 [Persea americana]
MVRVRVRVSFICSMFALLIILLLSTLDPTSSIDRENPRRSIVVLPKSKHHHSICKEMPSKAECVRNPKCRWCRSESIDDICFSSIEARRLPQQVFSCD